MINTIVEAVETTFGLASPTRRRRKRAAPRGRRTYVRAAAPRSRARRVKPSRRAARPTSRRRRY